MAYVLLYPQKLGELFYKSAIIDDGDHMKFFLCFILALSAFNNAFAQLNANSEYLKLKQVFEQSSIPQNADQLMRNLKNKKGCAAVDENGFQPNHSYQVVSIVFPDRGPLLPSNDKLGFSLENVSDENKERFFKSYVYNITNNGYEFKYNYEISFIYCPEDESKRCEFYTDKISGNGIIRETKDFIAFYISSSKSYGYCW